MQHYHRDQRLVDIVDDEWRKDTLPKDDIGTHGGEQTDDEHSESLKSSGKHEKKDKEEWEELGLGAFASPR